MNKHNTENNHKNIMNDIDEMLERTREKNMKELSLSLVKPMSPDYPFSTNGIYLFCGKIGSGKTYEVIKHILISERLFEQPYYSLIAFCSTSSSLDRTVHSFLHNIKTTIAFVPDTQLLPFLRKHIKIKKKYYALIQYINNNLKKPSEEMTRIIKKHNLRTKNNILKYIAAKLLKYGTSRYPANLLLILDDFASHPLLQKKDSELCRLLTKTRHYNITCIICVQTTKFVIKNIKRMLTDVILYKGLSEDDWINFMKEISHSFNAYDIWLQYHKLKDIHSKLFMHLTNNVYRFELCGDDSVAGINAINHSYLSSDDNTNDNRT